MSSVFPEEITIPPQGGGGAPGGAPGGAAPGGGGGGDPTPEEWQAVIDQLQDMLSRESDTSISAEVSKVINALYSLVSGQEDTEMKMLGGDPKQMRTMQKVTGGGGGGY